MNEKMYNWIKIIKLKHKKKNLISRKILRHIKFYKLV